MKTGRQGGCSEHDHIVCKCVSQHSRTALLSRLKVKCASQPSTARAVCKSYMMLLLWCSLATTCHTPHISRCLQSLCPRPCRPSVVASPCSTSQSHPCYPSTPFPQAYCRTFFGREGDQEAAFDARVMLLEPLLAPVLQLSYFLCQQGRDVLGAAGASAAACCRAASLSAPQLVIVLCGHCRKATA